MRVSCGQSTFLAFPEGGMKWDGLSDITVSYFAVPKVPKPRKCPAEVPGDVASEYDEACRALSVSPKASAALSRRCLQHVLRTYSKVKPGNLSDEIEEFCSMPGIPSAIVDAIDAVRNIGNFAAHPVKSTAAAEVLPVEPGEAEWSLDVLEALFDFLFVQPARLEKKRATLNAKLKEAGKKPMK